MAVIEAAQHWRQQRNNSAAGMTASSAFRLQQAVDALRNLDLEDPSAGAKSSVLAPDTSHEAYISMRKRFGPDARLVLDAIEWAWYRGSLGLTTEQICDRLSRKHQSISARVNELRDKGWIVDSGQRRQTVSRRNAIVWTLSDRARAALKWAQ
jgi:hypothetical protein